MATKNFEKGILKLEKNISEMKKDILEMKLEILGELKNMREENATHQFSHMRINDDLIEHDDRLRKLESAKI